MKETNKQRKKLILDEPIKADTVITWTIFIGIILIIFALKHSH